MRKIFPPGRLAYFYIMKDYAVIILAAGSSTRFGEAKQLASFNNKTFIEHVLSQAAAVVKNIFIVLGSNYDIIKKELTNVHAQIVYNNNWEAGMASSVHRGLSELLQTYPATEGVIFMVCDQPFVTSALLKELIAKHEETKKPIAACSYNNTTGTPVFFNKLFFPELLALTGQFGAKKIIAQNQALTTTIPFPLGYIDIDTKEDYETLQQEKFTS